MVPHIFFEDNMFLDLRYLVGAETFEFSGDDADDTPYGIGYLLEVGDTPQRLSATYATRAQRDQAFQHLTTRYQAWIAQTHTDEDPYT